MVIGFLALIILGFIGVKSARGIRIEARVRYVVVFVMLCVAGATAAYFHRGLIADCAGVFAIALAAGLAVMHRAYRAGSETPGVKT